MNRREFVKTTGVLSAISLIETTDAIALQQGITARYPRLYYDATTVAKFRARLTGDAALRARWQGFLRNCDRLVEEPLVPESEAEKDSTRGANTQHANYHAPAGQISNMGIALGFAYQVTGDERYARKLREALLHYTGYRQWYGPGYVNRIRPWRSHYLHQ